MNLRLTGGILGLTLATFAAVAPFVYGTFCSRSENLSTRLTRATITEQAKVEALDKLGSYEGPQTDGTCVVCIDYKPKDIKLWSNKSFFSDLLNKTEDCPGIPDITLNRFTDYTDLVDNYVISHTSAFASENGQNVNVRCVELRF